MGEIYSPAGGEEIETLILRELAHRSFSGDNGNLSRVQPNDGFGFAPSQGALVRPLAQLISIVIDPTWWTLYGALSGATTQRISLTFLDLEGGIAEQASLQYADTQVVGRPESFKSYTGTDNRQITLRAQFRAQGISGVNGENTIQTEVIRPARWLEGLKYPVVDSQGISHAPPTVELTLGELLVMRAIATDVSVTWMSPWDPITLLPLGADVEITFTAVHEQMGNYAYSGPTRFTGFQPAVG